MTAKIVADAAGRTPGAPRPAGAQDPQSLFAAELRLARRKLWPEERESPALASAAEFTRAGEAAADEAAETAAAPIRAPRQAPAPSSAAAPQLSPAANLEGEVRIAFARGMLQAAVLDFGQSGRLAVLLTWAGEAPREAGQGLSERLRRRGFEQIQVRDEQRGAATGAGAVRETTHV